jgi:hypothetical protein
MPLKKGDAVSSSASNPAAKEYSQTAVKIGAIVKQPAINEESQSVSAAAIPGLSVKQNAKPKQRKATKNISQKAVDTRDPKKSQGPAKNQTDKESDLESEIDGQNIKLTYKPHYSNAATQCDVTAPIATETDDMLGQRERIQQQAHKQVVLLADSILHLFTSVPMVMNPDGIRYASQLMCILNDLGADTQNHKSNLERNISLVRSQQQHQQQFTPWPFNGFPHFSPAPWFPAPISTQP